MCHLCDHRQSIYALSLHFCICEVEIIFTASTLGMIKGRYVFNVWHINAKKEKKSFTTLSLICYNFTIINPPWITCLSIAVVLTLLSVLNFQLPPTRCYIGILIWMSPTSNHNYVPILQYSSNNFLPLFSLLIIPFSLSSVH